jgi:hypothetical protein
MNLEIFKEKHDIIKSSGRIPMSLMPMTKEESVMICNEYPVEFYATLKPANVAECINSPICTLGAFKRATSNDDMGDMTVRAFVLIMLTDCISFFNIGKTMTEPQLAQTAEMIIDDYGFLKIDDFKLLFTYAKKGYYGAMYDCIDGNVILRWIESYLTDRMTTGSSMSDLEHDKIRSNEREAPSFMEIEMKHKK